MAYEEGLGDAGAASIQPGDWNSTKYPGVCKPTNFWALIQFKNLQTQLDRMAQVKGIKKIPVDGDIGPGTMSLIAKLQAAGVSIPFVGATCSSVAANADKIAAVVRVAASAMGAPETVTSPSPAKPASIVTPAGAEVVAPPEYQTNASSGFGALSGISGLIGAAGLVAIVWILHKDRRGKRGPRGKSSKVRARRRSRARRRPFRGRR